MDSESVTWVHWNEGTGKVEQPLDLSSPSEFVQLGKTHGVAGQRVFYKAQRIEGADPVTFLVLSETYSKDSEQVFFQGKTISGADPSKFQPIEVNYGIDDLSVYFRRVKIVGAIPSLFEVVAFESSSVYPCYLSADWFGCTEEYVNDGT